VALFFYLYIKILIMKIKLLTQIKKGGQIYKDGDILDIEDHKIRSQNRQMDQNGLG